METKKICLTKKELHEISGEAVRISYKTGHDMHAFNYIEGVFNLLAKPEKTSIFTKFSKFIDKKSDTFFMVFLVSTMFLLTKIAIESYFLSIK